MKRQPDKAIIRIRKFVKRHHISYAGFAKMTGLTDVTARRLFNDNFNPTLNTLRKMEAAISNYNPLPPE